MTETVDDVLAMRAIGSTSGLSRVMTWSFAVHLAVVFAFFFVPREWFAKRDESPILISISLGGTPGPQTTGTASLAGKTPEVVTPKPPQTTRPETARPADAKSDMAALAEKILKSAAPEARPSIRPPSASDQPSRGNARVETPSRTEGAGLSTGGGIGGERMGLDPNFCCMVYANTVLGLIDASWNRAHTERGLTVIKFEILRDGSITGIEYDQKSGSGLLDRAAMAAILDLQTKKAPRLPDEYKEDRLVIHLKFPYGGF